MNWRVFFSDFRGSRVYGGEEHRYQAFKARFLEEERRKLHECRICGGQVDLKDAKEPTVSWAGGKGKRNSGTTGDS